MSRENYFLEIYHNPSPLLLHPEDADLLIQIRSSDLCDNLDLYRSYANLLKQHHSEAAQTRAGFILRQTEGDVSQDFFLDHCEKWGIPIFSEGLLTAADFKNGFLWTFRDHSTSFGEDQEALHWFYTHKEAQFIMHYQFWDWSNDDKKIVDDHSGNYSSIIHLLVQQQQYEALISPVFSKAELSSFIFSYDETKEGLPIEDILEIIGDNPNWDL